MISRRKFLQVLGGGAIAAAVGTTAWVLTRDPASARQPWATAGQASDDPRRRALSYAILAPNPHNRQPWLADLSVKDEITLTCELGRRLEFTDPFDRQITIGLGAFLELLSQAAAQDGFATDIVIFPEGEPTPRLDQRPVARIRFMGGAQPNPDPLFAQALHRRTNRNPHDLSKPISVKTLTEISQAARTSRIDHAITPQRVAELRDLTWKAMFLEISTLQTAKESVDLMRIGKAEIEANPDGISLAGPFMEGLYQAGLMTKAEMLVPGSPGFQQMASAMKTPFDMTTAFLWLTTPANTRADQIRAGRDYVRINLAATGLGVAMQPVSQALQEFKEMAGLYADMHKALGVAHAEGLQMLTRIGYADVPKPSPRWPYETRIRLPS
jgi:hypothetical protein